MLYIPRKKIPSHVYTYVASLSREESRGHSAVAGTVFASVFPTRFAITSPQTTAAVQENSDWAADGKETKLKRLIITSIGFSPFCLS